MDQQTTVKSARIIHLLFVASLLLAFASCRTCNCPAYSSQPPGYTNTSRG